MSKQLVIKVLDTSIECFKEIADILEHKPTLVGILDVHDKCLDLRRVFEKARTKVGDQS